MAGRSGQNSGSSSEIQVPDTISNEQIVTVTLIDRIKGDSFRWSAKRGDILFNGESENGTIIYSRRIQYKAPNDIYTDDEIKITVFPSGKAFSKSIRLTKFGATKPKPSNLFSRLTNIFKFFLTSTVVAAIIGALAKYYLESSPKPPQGISNNSISHNNNSPSVSNVGIIRGHVVDAETGNGIQTKIILEANGVSSTVESGSDGNFQFSQNQTANVRIQIDTKGYEKYDKPVILSSNRIEDIKLQPLKITQQEAEQAISRWLQTKTEIFGGNSNQESPEIQALVESVTTGPLEHEILKDGGSISDLTRDGQYWVFLQSQIMSILMFKPDGGNRATMTVRVIEERHLKNRETGRVVRPDLSSNSPEKVEYVLKRIDETIKVCWYYDPKHLKAEDPYAIQQCLEKSP
jgi:hypothetical protein